MDKHTDKQIGEIKNCVLEMGGAVEKALALLADAFKNNKRENFDKVRQVEDKINLLHMEIDSLCLKALAQQSPVAKDLRFILSILKMNTDLERMGDQCVNISYSGDDYLQSKPMSEMSKVQDMAEKVRLMLNKTLDCFVRADVVVAKIILSEDDAIDDYKNKIFQLMVNLMKNNPDQIVPALDIILMARNFERIADHCTNIAEDVIFAFTGKDVRHGGSHV